MIILGHNNDYGVLEQDAIKQINAIDTIAFMGLTSKYSHTTYEATHPIEEITKSITWVHSSYTYVTFHTRHTALAKLWAKSEANCVPDVLVNGAWKIEYDFVTNYDPTKEYKIEQHLVDCINNNC
jgi:hypothetical protein